MHCNSMGKRYTDILLWQRITVLYSISSTITYHIEMKIAITQWLITFRISDLDKNNVTIAGVLYF
jgi:hypothetical protein